MIEIKRCPICKATTGLVRIGTSYNLIKESPQNILQAGINAVLVHVARNNGVFLSTMKCSACHHFYVTPTFEPDEISRFYSSEMYEQTREQYRKSEKISGKSWATQHGIKQASQSRLLIEERDARPLLLRDFVISSSSSSSSSSRAALTPRRILDIGGMDGRLMSGFPEAERFVFDLNPKSSVSPGVVFLNNANDVARVEKFDLLIMSHVLEHEPNPVDLIRRYLGCVADGGRIYLEVPLEYQSAYVRKRGFPIGGHIGFFTASSLQRLANEAGLSVTNIARGVFPYGEMRIPILKLLAEKNSGSVDSKFERHKSFLADLAYDLYLLMKHRYVRGR